MSESKKCVIIGPAFPLRGGIAQLNESLSAEFTRQGIENTIFSFYMQYPGFLFPGTSQTEAIDRKGPEGVKINSTISSINPISWWLTARKIARYRPDFVVVRYWLPFMGPCLGTICKWVKKATGVPVLAILDNVVPHEKRIGDKAFTRYFTRQIDGYITMSSTVEKELEEFDTDKPRKLLYHPVYDHFGEKVDKAFARKHLSIPEEQNVILFFGIIRKYKGLKLLLQALSKVQNKKGLKLIVAGEFYEDRAKYTKLIDKLGLQDVVKVNAGFVDKHKVKYYFCAADIVAQPYLSATQSGVTQIAYHFEVPMLVTDVGGLPEMVPHKKVGFVCARDAQEIANSIEEFFSLDDNAPYHQNILEQKKKFQWDYFAREVSELAERIQ